MITLSALVFGGVAAASTGFGQIAPQWWSPLKAEQIAGKQVFDNHCAVCHVQMHAGHTFGPSLSGVANRPAGSLAGFPYSDALKTSGLVWNEDNLRKWIAEPDRLVPKTLMPHVSITNPAEQVYVVAYIMQWKGPPSK